MNLGPLIEEKYLRTKEKYEFVCCYVGVSLRNLLLPVFNGKPEWLHSPVFSSFRLYVVEKNW